MPILNVYKPKGLTPLQTINLLRKNMPEYQKKTIGFAGRLDPLAHGVLLLMIGEETTKQREKYLNLPKQYEFEAIFGVATDTYDTLGLVNNETIKQFNNEKNLKTEIENFIKRKLGKQTQIYPPYSSKTVKGKPLYKWAREGKLHEIEIPKREIEIENLQLIEIKTITAENLKKEIVTQINSVDGDFRQKEIKEKWQKFFEEPSRKVIPAKAGIQRKLDSRFHGNDKIKKFLTAKFKISCSSGTYVRSLVHEMGEHLGIGAIALEILRTKIGLHTLEDSKKII